MSTIRTVSITEARRRFYALIAEVEAGCEIIITRYGKPVARLLPALHRPRT